MHIPTAQNVRDLALVRADDEVAVTCYLNVDGRRRLRPADYETALENLVRRARRRPGAQGRLKAVKADLEKIRGRVEEGFDRSVVRGCAIFSCGARGVFEAYELPVPVVDELRVSHAFAVRQLERILEECRPLGLLLADRHDARFLVYEMGVRAAERSLRLEPGATYDTKGHIQWADNDHRSLADDERRAHQIADLAWEVYGERRFAHLALGVTEELAPLVQRKLHPYLKEMLAGTIGVGVRSSEEEIRRAALEIDRELERRREQRLVESLREAVAGRRGGLAGLDAVLEALADHRVSTLLVSAGFTREGWWCPTCGSLAAVGRSCRRCGGEMQEVDDVVEEAVDDALAQGCAVEVCVENADLDVLGQIGALSRY